MMGDEARRSAESGDFLQGLWVEVLKRPEQMPREDESAQLRWLTAVARNNIRDAVRKRREQALLALSSSFLPAGDPATPLSNAVHDENVVRLAECIEQLLPDHQLVIELRSLEGLSFREVGQRMERGEDAARKLYARAILGLGQRLRKQSR